MIERLIGRWLRKRRAGEGTLLSNDPAFTSAPLTVALGSPAFAAGAPIPDRYAAPRRGENVSPPLAWSGLPAGTRELALVMEDPDVPLPWAAVHLIAATIDPAKGGLKEGELSGADRPDDILLGRNARGRAAYAGPRALAGHGPHHYVFQLFALRERLSFAKAPSLGELKDAMHGRVLARGRLEGTYERP